MSHAGEGGSRDGRVLWPRLVRAVGIVFSLFHLYTGAFGTFIPMVQRPVHLGFAAVLAFLIFPCSGGGGRASRALDGALAALSFAVLAYFASEGPRIMSRMPLVDPLSALDLAMGVALLVLTLEATRRAAGLSLAITALAFLAYTVAGPLFPGLLRHKGYSLGELLDQMAWTDEGVFGIPLGVSATYVVLFVILGAFINKTGTGFLFRDLSYAIAGHWRGGPAKIAVLFSAFFGSITGSSVANVYGTGTFTIPMMKRVGYEPEVAGGIEATASCGGQIMPPVMGAVAFIMAELLGISYVSILGYALIPAVLYFFSVAMMVHFHAAKRGIGGVRTEGVPPLSKLLGRRGYLLVPLVGLIYLLVAGYSPMRAALAAVLLSCGVGLLERLYLPRGPERFGPRAFFEALETGARWTVSMSLACAAAGVVVGAISMTGLGFAFVEVTLRYSLGIQFLALLLAMAGVIILGMGMPTTVAYLMAAAFAGPALIKFGIAPIVAHMFIFYFAVFANITPPVAIAAYAGASLAGADFMRTALWALRVGVAAVIIPFMFVYSPSLLGIGSAPRIVAAFVTALVGVAFLATAAEGYLARPLRPPERLLVGAGSLLLIHPDPLTDAAGGALILLVVGRHLWAERRARGLALPVREVQPARPEP